MNKLTLNILLLPNITGAFFCLFNKFSLPAFAQVSPDGTTSTTVEVDGSNNFTINNGDLAGDNLFHSFQDFSIPTNGSASFNNAANIANIFSRVTGGNISDIDGLISANGTANLFLINPAGILFGENASLSIGGSFYGTTADSILFDDGELNALDADNPPLLTINAPIGLSFRDNPAEIQVQETNITLQPNQTLAFLGGDIDIQGGALEAPNGQILLGGLGTTGTVTLDENLSFTIPENLTRGDVSISDGTQVNVGADQGGTISLQGKNITVADDGTIIFSGILPELGNSESQGGTIEFNATESVTLTDSARIDASSFGEGSAGNIIISASDSVIIDNQTSLFTASTTDQGVAGNVAITTNNFALNNESRISAVTTGVGNAGDINIEANSVSLNNTGLILNSTLGAGNAGDINIQTQTLTLNDGSEIVSNTEGEGNAGNIQVIASDSVSISGVAPVEVFFESFPGGFSSGLFSASEAGATGQGGTISVTTGQLSISDGATLGGRTRSTALGGDIIVNADSINISGGGQILTAAFAEGNAGDITLNVANEINISGSDPTFFSRREQVIELASEINTGQLNDLEQTIDPVSPESGIFASIGSDSLGSAGNIFIGGVMTAASDSLLLPQLSLANDGQIAVNSRGGGNGGNVSIQGNSLTLENNAAILADTPQGQGGNINLDIEDNVTLQEESLISAVATNNANGGNIDIDANFIVAFPNQNSDIIASAEQGAGGNINIITEALLGIEERPQNPLTNDIDASSAFGVSGNVSIITPDVEVFQGVVELPTNVTEADTVASNACSTDPQSTTSSFVVQGKRGIAPRPDELLSTDLLLINGEAKTSSTSPTRTPSPLATPTETPQIHSISTAMGEIILAQGAIVTEDGQVILTSEPQPNNSDYRTSNNSVNCG